MGSEQLANVINGVLGNVIEIAESCKSVDWQNEENYFDETEYCIALIRRKMAALDRIITEVKAADLLN